MLALVLALASSAAPSVSVVATLPGTGSIGAAPLDDGRFVLLNRRWANVKTGDASDLVLELDVADVATQQTRTLTLPMKPLHGAASELFVDGTNLHPTRGKAIAPFDLDVTDFRPEAKEVSFLVKNSRKSSTGDFKRRWLWVVLDAEDGHLVRAHRLHEESGTKDEEPLFRLAVDGVAPGGKAVWLHGTRRAPVDGGRESATITAQKFDLTTGEAVVTKQFSLPPSAYRNRLGLHFAANGDFSALVFAEYSEQAAEPLDPRPRAHVVSTTSDEVSSFEIPYTPYALALDAKGERLLLGSNQSRTLRVYRVKDGKVLAEVKVGAHLQKAFLLPGEAHLLALYNGATAELRAWPTLKPATTVSAKALGLVAFHGEGAFLSADGTLVVTRKAEPSGLTTLDGGAVVLRVK